jgi:hypothetical protein
MKSASPPAQTERQGKAALVPDTHRPLFVGPVSSWAYLEIAFHLVRLERFSKS